ncbi:MAG: type VI secretion system tip protein TssI/VgrG, partial [Collimonas sp.]|uniref:type VI secretion system Vgr family protein n=1 Tax=Collimonas sp. TaxID=1963772 RepID=UPI0032637224
MANAIQTLQSLTQGRQHARMLRLEFPHQDGPQSQLLVNKLDAKEGLSRDFTFTLEILSDNPNLELKDVQGKMLCVSLVQKDRNLRYFNGICYSFRLLRSDAGITFYQAELGPWIKYLRLRKDCYIFHSKTLREQSELIFSDYSTLPDWDVHVRGQDPTMTDAVQFNESDHNYLHRRWEDAGWYYWYEHTAKGHKLILSDDSTQAAPINGDAEIRFQRHVGAQEEDGIFEWSPIRHIVASSSTVGGFNFKNPVPVTAGVPTLNKQGGVLSLEQYEYTGAYSFKNAQGADSLSKMRMEEIEAHAKEREAAGNNSRVVPGRTFQFTGHFNDSVFGGREEASKNEYLIIDVHHIASNNYLQQADEQANYSNRLTCIRKMIPWRPGRSFQSTPTLILAPQTATVVGPSGPDSVHTDQYGRVRLQFHWDRIGNNDEKSFAFVRSAVPWAGGQKGTNAIHRVGSEVVVMFLDGNPDHPLIIGGVYNERKMPPWKLPTQQALSGTRTRELVPDGGNKPSGRSNNLVFDDTADKIQVQLRSDHQDSMLSLGHITRIEDNTGRKDARGEGFALETGAAGAVRGGRGLLLTTDGRAKAVGGTLSRDELISCLEKALDIAKGLGDAASAHQGGKRDPKPQQSLSEAVDALGHGTGNETDAKGPAPGGQPVIAISSPAGIASATPKDQTIYAGENIDTVAGRNQQHYAAQSILHTAGKDIEQFSVDGDIRTIANKGKVIQQAQNNLMEITA